MLLVKCLTWFPLFLGQVISRLEDSNPVPRPPIDFASLSNPSNTTQDNTCNSCSNSTTNSDNSNNSDGSTSLPFPDANLLSSFLTNCGNYFGVALATSSILDNAAAFFPKTNYPESTDPSSNPKTPHNPNDPNSTPSYFPTLYNYLIQYENIGLKHLFIPDPTQPNSTNPNSTPPNSTSSNSTSPNSTLPNSTTPTGIFPTEYSRLVFSCLIGIGYTLFIWGDNLRHFNLTLLIFVYLFTFIFNSLQQTTYLTTPLLSIPITSSSPTKPQPLNLPNSTSIPVQPFFFQFLHSTPGKIILSLLLCGLISFLLIYLVQLFFKTSILIGLGWFFFFGPGRYLIQTTNTSVSLAALVALCIFSTLCLRYLEKRLEAFVFRIFFGFFGTTILFFASAQILSIPFHLPAILLNFPTPTPPEQPTAEFCTLLLATTISIHIQSIQLYKVNYPYPPP
ncbi:hypothetical protein NEHOM01_1879 [Nematocida homosporus]|uniref:uncharacterized protein n=1 Tax=Nematocida homosporus TaxID=1912981 RepID=UPI0022212415|nr:uncharacterized protein NEHOM01_1879 [Nematocida homosporus]KAI5187034.1 hypothetical protein NEHOM01_1879 [Nematocida homosporus]